MARTTSNYKTLTPTVGTLTNSEGAFRPDTGVASSQLFLGVFDILPQLDLPGSAIAPLTGLELLIDNASSTTGNSAIQISITSGSTAFFDKANHTNGNAVVTTTPQTIIFGSSSLAGGVWKDGSNNNLPTGSGLIQMISSASSTADKLRATILINASGNTTKFSNLRARLTYTPGTAASSPFRRPISTASNTEPGGGTGFLGAVNLLEGNSGDAESNITGSIIEIVFPSFDIPDTATILGYEVHASASNDGSGSTPDYGTLGVTSRLLSGSVLGTLNAFQFLSGDGGGGKSIGFGGEESLQGLNSLNPADVNDGIKLRVEYSSSTGTNDTGSFSIIGGSEANIFPALRVYFANTPTSSYSRLQLRNRVKATEDFAANDVVTFKLENNLNSTAYFNIEGKIIGDNKRQDIFNTASIASLVSCSMVTESIHAGFIINPSSTASFKFTPSANIDSESVEFIAANPQIFNLSDRTSSGSVFGVDLNLE